MKNSGKLIQLNSTDNVLIAGRKLAEGEKIVVSGKKIIIVRNIELGFKLAAKNIAKGEKIIKYGVSIGSATTDILMGEVVHVHNLQSDYSQTYTIANQNDYEGK